MQSQQQLFPNYINVAVLLITKQTPGKSFVFLVVNCPV